MKIAQFCDSYLPAIDGVINVVRNLATTLNREYGSCVIVAPRSPGYVDEEEVEVIRCHAMKIKQRPPYMFGIPMLDGKTQHKLERRHFEVIHAHTPFTLGYEALRLARQENIPIIASFHSKYYDDIKQATKSTVLAKLGTQMAMDFYRHVDIVLTVSNGTVQTMRDYGYEGAVRILPNGVNTDFPAHPDALIEKVNIQFGLDPQVPVLLFVGQQIWQKGIKTIVDACALLKAQGQPYHMVLAGNGYAQEDIKKYTEKCGVADRFTFAGLIPDRTVLSGLYLRSSLFVFPSPYDNAPLVVREAAVHHCPSIVLENTNAAEGIANGINGFLCENTAEALCGRITEILAHDEYRRQTGIRASQTLPLSWEQVADKAYSIYCEAIAGKAGR